MVFPWALPRRMACGPGKSPPQPGKAGGGEIQQKSQQPIPESGRVTAAKSPQLAMYAAALMELVPALNLVVGAVAGVVMKAGTTSADDQDPEYLRPGIKTTYASCSFDREFANTSTGTPSLTVRLVFPLWLAAPMGRGAEAAWHRACGGRKQELTIEAFSLQPECWS